MATASAGEAPRAGRAASAELTSTALDPQSRAWSLAATSTCLLPLLLQLPLRMAVIIALAGVSVSALSWRVRLPGWLRLLLSLAAIGFVLAGSRFAFGRDTGCALLAAMLAIKPVELSTLRDARSLIGFALFAPFATFLLDQGPLSLLLGVLGATLALAALLRLSELESGDHRRPLPPLRRFVTVSRLVMIGLPLALAAFWLFPRIGTPLWGVPERALARPGLSDRMSPGEWIDLLADDTVALRVTFDDAVPPRSGMYWRGPVLWNFDGRTWTQSSSLQGRSPAETVPSGRRFRYEIELEATDRRQVVALDLPLFAPDGLQRTLESSLIAPRPLTAATRWRLESAAPLSFEAALPAAHRASALTLPEGFNPRTVALARRWRSELGAGNDAAMVQRALRWIRSDFAYTLATPLLGRHSVDEFLFEQQAGFCEHFSSAFVVLMRAAGVPARVVLGYAGGYRNPYGGYWLVRRSDAHAWAEVWLPERGWVRVDPTAAVAPERIYDTLDDRTPGVFGDFRGLVPVYGIGDFLRRGWNDLVLGFDAARQQRLLRPFGIDELETGELIALFALLGGLALAAMLWLVARGERERDPVLRAWRRVGARYARLGLARAPHETAGDWAARVVATRPQSASLSAISARFAAWRYAHRQHDKIALRELLRDLRAHRP